MIHITNGQSDDILDFITENNFFSDVHRQSLQDNLETYEFTTFADKPFSEHLGKLNRVIIPAEDQGYKEFIINESLKYRDTSGLKAEIYADASYLTLKKAEPIVPQTFKEETSTTAVSRATNGTEWRPGIIEVEGYRTFHIEEHTNPYAFLKRIASEFGLELRFRVEVKGGRIIGRYVDLLERMGQWRGREVEFGRDLIGIQRREKTDNIYTALKGLGPKKDDGTHLEVIVTDEEALQRWGRPDPISGELQHLWDTYEPQSTDQEMTKSRLRELTENELEKRVNEVVEYESTIADLENVPGMENKKIRFGDTIKIRDTKFNPPLYLEARVHTQERSIKNKSQKNVVLGDYIEYTEEEVQAVWQSMQAEIRRRLARMLITNIASTAGDTFKNGVGETELTAEVFLSGSVVDETGENYTYVWNKRDKNGIPISDWNKSGKTITVSAVEIDEKATFTVDVIQDTVLSIGRITITNVFDGKDGQPGEQGVPGPPGEDGKTLYTWVKYADDEMGNGMSDSPVGKEYMGIAYNKSSPTKGTNPNDYTWAETKGKQGVPGEPGADGTPRYTWTKYADDKDGNGMSDSPDGKRYLGLAYNKTTATESNNASDYSWSPLYDNVKVGTTNLFVINTAIQGYYDSDGTYNPDNDSILTSQFVKVDNNEPYTFSKYDQYFNLTGEGYFRIAQFDSNKNFLRRATSSDPVYHYKFGSDVAFVRLGVEVGNRVKFEEGNIKTSYSLAPEDERNIGGRNLVIGSRETWDDVTVGQYGASQLINVPIDGKFLKHGDVVTFSIYVSGVPSGEQVYPRLDWYRDDNTYSAITDASILISDEGRMQITATVPLDKTFTRISARIMPYEWTSNFTVNRRYEQLEIGSTVSSWKLAPEDERKYVDDSKNEARLEGGWVKTYNVRDGNGSYLLHPDGSNFNDAYTYEVQARTTGTGSETTAIALFKSKGDGNGFDLIHVYQMGTSSNHPRFYMYNNQPMISTWHSSFYNVEVTARRYRGRNSPSNAAGENAEGYADTVSEAAYLDALQDAEEYMEANGIMQGAEYNGVSFTNEDGIVTVRGDGLVRTVSNSTLGYVIQRRASTSSPWVNVLYFDTNGNMKLDNAFLRGRIEALEGFFGNNMSLSNGELQITRPDGAVWMQSGLTQQDYNVSSIDPYDMDYVRSTTGQYIDGVFRAARGFYRAGAQAIIGGGDYQDIRDPEKSYSVKFTSYEFIHTARYLVIGYHVALNSTNPRHHVDVYDGSNRLYIRWHEPGGVDSYSPIILDLGIPTYNLLHYELRLGVNRSDVDSSNTLAFRVNRVYLTDFI
ncbi:phage tail spike protein [Oceanobacillus kapialis]|uniref:Phage tail spike protein n=1 Tax=Oceanobacillus kapialis TaxID=481353 RepID=A0ABW5PZH8_9BACI